MAGKRRKAINFDLDTKTLKEVYCTTNKPLEYLKAYKEIESFMKGNGFSHRQWSGYISDGTMSKAQVERFVEKLSNTFPWLSKCVKKFDVTDIGKQYNMIDYISSCDDAKKSRKSSEKAVTSQIIKPLQKPHSSLSQLKANAKAQIEKREQDKGQSISQNKVKNYNER